MPEYTPEHEAAARLRYGEMNAMEEQIRAAEAKLKAMQSEGANCKTEWRSRFWRASSRMATPSA